MFHNKLGDALVKGGLPPTLVAIVLHGAGIEITPLAAWNLNEITSLKLLFSLAGGTASYYFVKQRSKRITIVVASVECVICAAAWHLYWSQSSVPESINNYLSADVVLYAEYLTGYACFAATLGAIIRLGLRR